MAEPYLSEIRLFSFNYPPHGWAACDGQLLPINQNTALFSLMGTYYGGNGIQTFALPNLQGRAILHQSADYPIGNFGGESGHTLLNQELPDHAHALHVGGAGTSATPAGELLAEPAVNPRLGSIYSTAGGSSAAVGSISASGQSQPHNNMQPYTVLNYSIALSGIFPSRS